LHHQPPTSNLNSITPLHRERERENYGKTGESKYKGDPTTNDKNYYTISTYINFSYES